MNNLSSFCPQLGFSLAITLLWDAVDDVTAIELPMFSVKCIKLIQYQPPLKVSDVDSSLEECFSLNGLGEGYLTHSS